MTRLKLSDLASEKPVRLTLEIPARLHRELAEYARAVNGGNPDGAPAIELIIPAMLDRFIATDREFARTRKSQGSS
ncbi:DUF2274 domain-containing protein [Blastomonas aquatica]|uniref:DUF2274 domain-containing protein n=1 Tax=Blastomonas aquatica TaxID=1510276 RepID=A0ABQ1IZH9_9SPHN|nr:DUF2274 domain-containing protein [Blastomonas aquatica]GGB56016.1 hypothetical protein GCM10010833_08410 [Blastomonas aquatica]